MPILLFVISGPSGVGKRCVLEGVDLYSKLGLLECAYKKIVLYNTRDRRLNETDGRDYHYCYGESLTQGPSHVQRNKQLVANEKTPSRIAEEKMGNPHGDLFTFSVRKKDLQGIDLRDLQDGVNFLEIYDKFIDELSTVLVSRSIHVFRVFISPFTQNEMLRRATESGHDKATVIREEMRGRVVARRDLGLSQEDETEITKRTDSAVNEVEGAFAVGSRYDAIVVNPCGEAHPAWGTSITMPTGEATRVVDTVCDIIRARLRMSLGRSR